MGHGTPLVSVLVALFAAGCTTLEPSPPVAEGQPTGNDPSSASSSGGSGGPTAPVFVSDAGVSGVDAAPSVPADQCTDATRLVYVVSRENALYSFAPATMTFTEVGTIACPSESSEFPFSMAVDRTGTAWVLFTDGNLFNVSTKDASCTRTTFIPDQAGFSLFGMAFVSDGPDASTDTLYVSENVNGNGLGDIAIPSLKLSAVGPYTGALAGQKAELTGNGDGNLYGFFLMTPAQVASITTTNGAVASANPLPTVSVGTDWAFSFWGGSFYLYTGNSTDPSQNGSTVTRYSPDDGSVTVLSTGVGFFITGAGVSTCAPTVAPPTPPPP
ncbi:MAG: hypothetical protein ACLQVI_38510 [Polyangiaceae bacterium]